MPGVAEQVPGAADRVARLEDRVRLARGSRPAGGRPAPMPGEAGADDQDVDVLGRGLVLWRVHRIDPGRYVVGNCDAALQKVKEFRLMMKSMGTSVRRVWLAGLIAVAAALTFASGAFAHGSPATLSARGSVEQVQVTGATPGEQLMLLANGGRWSTSKPAGALGGVVFRKVEPGGGYRVASNGTTSAKLTVLTEQVGAAEHRHLRPGPLEDGYGYLTTRDGTKLAIDVHLPGPAEDGPYPTLVEYSGYGYANPAGPQSGIQPDRQPARLRGRRRQHARHRLLGRRLRLLRAAAVARRLRRDRDRRPPALGAAQQGRDDRASPTAASASSSSPPPGRPASPRSRRCR